MKRRSFIRISAVLSVTVLLPYSIISCDTYFKILTTPVELLKIMPQDVIRKIGKNYIKKFPTEAKKDLLIALLVKNENQSSTALEKMITNDFISGNTIIINGWVIAQTEARQCALYTLIN